MFESVVIRRPLIVEKYVDPGLLAEVLLFYQNVHLILDHGSLISLVRAIGVDNFLSLIEQGHMRASFLRQSLGTQTSTHTGIPTYDFISFQLAEKDGRIPSRESVFREALKRAGVSFWSTRRTAKKLLDLMPTEEPEVRSDKVTSILDLTRGDMDDADYVSAAAEAVVRGLAPTFQVPTGWHFRPIKTNQGLVVDNNYDFEAINDEYHKLVPPEHSSVTVALILSHLIDARADLAFGCKHMSELVTTPMSSQVLHLKFSMMLEKRLKNAAEIELFQEVYLDDMRAIREAINSGERSFSDFLEVLDDAKKFKDWLKGAHPEVGLIKEYHAAATGKTWADKLPAKSIRFAFFTGAGVFTELVAPTGLGTAAGLGLGAADTFLLDSVIKGWRPSQFVEGGLRDFTNPKA